MKKFIYQRKKRSRKNQNDVIQLHECVLPDNQMMFTNVLNLNDIQNVGISNLYEKTTEIFYNK